MHDTSKPRASTFSQTVPFLKDSVEVFTSDDEVLHLLPATLPNDFAIVEPVAAHHLALKLLDGIRTVEQVVGTVSDETGVAASDVENFLTDLAAAGLLENHTPSPTTLTPDEIQRYDRQLRYFSELLPYSLNPTVIQERLRSARVGILGLGGIGSWTTLSLASAGVGTLRLGDGDNVDVSNLNRQVLYRNLDIGALKTSAARTAVANFNPYIKVETHAGMLTNDAKVAEFCDGCDVVVEAADTPVGVLSRLINGACVSFGIPHIIMSQYPPMVRVGPTFVPETTGCYECYERASRDEFEHYDALSSSRTERGARGAAFGPICGIVGNLVANEVINLLSGAVTPATTGAAYTLDTRTLALTREDVINRSEDCPVCARTGTSVE